MSRIGKLPVIVPAGVDSENNVTVKGPKGTLTESISKEIEIKQEDGQILVSRKGDSKLQRSLHGLSRTLVSNMVTGVTNGYEKALEIQGVGYRAAKQGKKLVLNVGYSHPVEIEETADISIDVPAQNKIVIKGINKQKVGQFAADVRNVRKPEVYHGKGIRYEGEYVPLKEGKTGKK